MSRPTRLAAIINQALHEFLTQLKIEHSYKVIPGAGHDPRRVYDGLGDRALGWYLKTWP